MSTILYREAVLTAARVVANTPVLGKKHAADVGKDGSNFYVRYYGGDDDNKVTLYMTVYTVSGSGLVPKVEVSFPSIYRSPKQAREFIALLTEVTALAERIEAELAGKTIIVEAQP